MENQEKTEIVAKKEKTTLEKVQEFLFGKKTAELVYDYIDNNNDNNNPETVENIALIQCFYGQDINRINATTQALLYNKMMTKMPSAWIFIEAQKSKENAVFGHLRNDNRIKYIFVKIPDGNSNCDGICLKNSLWNIGAKNCTEKELLFLDSDVVMCNSDWVEKCHKEFANKNAEVMSLASYQYYQNDEKCILHESIAHKWIEEGMINNSHLGFTFGITRNALREIGGFKAAITLDDYRTWYTIMGKILFIQKEKWTKGFQLDKNHDLGFNLKIGCPKDNVACHLWHGLDNRDKYHKIIKLLSDFDVNDIDELIEIDKKTELPIWKDWNNPKKKNKRYDDIQQIRKLITTKILVENSDDYDEDEIKAVDIEKLPTMGGIKEKDEKPLIVVSVIRDCFGLELNDFIEFKRHIEYLYDPYSHKCPPTVVFITNVKKFDFDGLPNIKYATSSELTSSKIDDLEYIKQKYFKEESKIYNNKATLVYIPPTQIIDFEKIDFSKMYSSATNKHIENGIQFMAL